MMIHSLSLFLLPFIIFGPFSLAMKRKGSDSFLHKQVTIREINSSSSGYHQPDLNPSWDHPNTEINNLDQKSQNSTSVRLGTPMEPTAAEETLPSTYDSKPIQSTDDKISNSSEESEDLSSEDYSNDQTPQMVTDFSIPIEKLLSCPINLAFEIIKWAESPLSLTKDSLNSLFGGFPLSFFVEKEAFFKIIPEIYEILNRLSFKCVNHKAKGRLLRIIKFLDSLKQLKSASVSKEGVDFLLEAYMVPSDVEKLELVAGYVAKFDSFFEKSQLDHLIKWIENLCGFELFDLMKLFEVEISPKNLFEAMYYNSVNRPLKSRRHYSTLVEQINISSFCLTPQTLGSGKEREGTFDTGETGLNFKWDFSKLFDQKLPYLNRKPFSPNPKSLFEAVTLCVYMIRCIGFDKNILDLERLLNFDKITNSYIRILFSKHANGNRYRLVFLRAVVNGLVKALNPNHSIDTIEEAKFLLNLLGVSQWQEVFGEKILSKIKVSKFDNLAYSLQNILHVGLASTKTVIENLFIPIVKFKQPFTFFNQSTELEDQISRHACNFLHHSDLSFAKKFVKSKLKEFLPHRRSEVDEMISIPAPYSFPRHPKSSVSANAFYYDFKDRNLVKEAGRYLNITKKDELIFTIDAPDGTIKIADSNYRVYIVDKDGLIPQIYHFSQVEYNLDADLLLLILKDDGNNNHQSETSELSYLVKHGALSLMFPFVTHHSGAVFLVEDEDGELGKGSILKTWV
jgi:hypothetical protein